MRRHNQIMLSILAGACFTCGVPPLVAAQSGQPAKTLRVTLLGTGRPDPVMDRFGPSTLVEAGNERLLFDAGRGASQRLWQLGIPLGRVTGLFLTHLHSDHTVGIPDLWLTGWLPTPFGRRVAPLEVSGPLGTRAMMAGLRQAFQWDIDVRARQEGLPLAGVALVTHDIAQGVVFDRNGVKVTAFTVDHGPLLKPALGYRVDYAGRSVVISGDTRYSENLIQFAAGTDLLVHEVAAVRPELLASSATAPVARRILSWHSSPEDASRVFERVRPKLAVLSHLVLLSTDPALPPPDVTDLPVRARAVYSGPVVIGEDRMTFVVGDSVEVQSFAHPSPSQRR